MKIRFTNFWDSFDVHENLFTEYIRLYSPELEISSNRQTLVDIEFFSVFPTTLEKIWRKLLLGEDYFNFYQARSSKVKVWFTGENIDPPLKNEFDLYLSFSQESTSNSFYFPLWKLDIDWFNTGRKNPRTLQVVTAHSLVQGRTNQVNKGKRACAFINNMTAERKHMIAELNKVIPVDVFGASTGNPVDSKIEASRDYQFTFCPENTLSRGYTTEKVVEAYASNTIPIYIGMLPHGHKFNLESFFYSESFELSDGFLDQISRATTHELEEMYMQPLFTEEPLLSEFEALGNLIKANSQF